MNVTIDNLGPCKKLLRIELEAEKVNSEFDKTARAYRRQANIPGFRKGKAPLDFVFKQYGEGIEKEVKRQLISSAYEDAVKEHKLRIIGYPDIEEIQFGRDQEMIFGATVETSPEFEVPEYKGLDVKVENRTVTDADMERALTALREQRATYEDVDRPIEEGDFAIVNYSGTADGKPLAEIAASARGLSEKKDFWINIKPDGFLPGFTEQLKGAKTGDKLDVKVTFPADFVAKELADKEGVYAVEITKVKTRKLPDVDEEFAKSYDAENVEALQKGIREDLERELKTNKARAIRDQLVGSLLSKADFELPESVLETETKNVIYDLVRENQQRGISQQQIEQKKDEIYAFANNSAKDRVKSGFMLSRIAEKEGIKVSKEELTQRITALAASYNIPPQKFVKQLQERNGIAQIHEQIIIGKTLDFIELNAKIEETAPAPEAAEAPAES